MFFHARVETRPGFASVTPWLHEAKLSPESIDFWKMALVSSRAWRSADVAAGEGAFAPSFQICW